MARLPIVFVLIAVVAALVISCGGDDDGGDDAAPTATAPASETAVATPVETLEASPELEAYFAELEPLSVEQHARSDELDIQLDVEGYDSEEEALAAIRSFLTQGIEIMNDFVAELSELEPPEEAAQAHQAAIAGGSGVVAEFESLLEASDDADSTVELESLFSGLVAGNEAFTRFGQSCGDLQTIADRHGIAVDLECS